MTSIGNNWKLVYKEKVNKYPNWIGKKSIDRSIKD